MKTKIIFSISCFLIFSLNLLSQWIHVPIGEPVISIASNSTVVLAGTSPYGVKKTTNMGLNWLDTGFGAGFALSLIVDGNYVLCGTNPWGVLCSTNNGTNWFHTSLNDRDVYSFTRAGNNIYAGTILYGVYLSTNHGLNWSQTTLNNVSVYAVGGNSNCIFAGSDSLHGVFLSTNNGNSWIQTSLNNKIIVSLAANGENIFAGTSLYGVFRSTDNGNSWYQTTLNNESILSLVIFQNYIFAGGTNFFLSSDNGITWISKNENLHGLIWDMCIFNNYIFAAAEDFGIFKRPISELVGLEPFSEEIPDKFLLYQNFPNPFNPSTIISFDIPISDLVKLSIFDALGREISTLVNESLSAGTYEVEWDASDYPSGVYFYKLTSGNYSKVNKMVLLK